MALDDSVLIPPAPASTLSITSTPSSLRFEETFTLRRPDLLVASVATQGFRSPRVDLPDFDRVNSRSSGVGGEAATMSTPEGLRQREVADIVHDNDPTQQKYVSKAYRKTAEVAKRPGVPSLIVAVALPLVLGMLVSLFNGPSQWYNELSKPFWTPPGPIFGLIWTFIYPLMGLASWLVWADGGFQRNSFPLGAYAVQLVLNLLWSVLFFRMHTITGAFVDILALAAAVFTCIGAFQPVNHVAANLMKIYLGWVLFASFLTFTILVKNIGGGKTQAE